MAEGTVRVQIYDAMRRCSACRNLSCENTLARKLEHVQINLLQSERYRLVAEHQILTHENAPAELPLEESVDFKGYSSEQKS